MTADDYLSDEKTIYTITDEEGERSTITVEKWVGDLLQTDLPDVHAWIQATYDRVSVKLPHLSRRQKGDAVRQVARKEAEKSKQYVPLLNFL